MGAIPYINTKLYSLQSNVYKFVGIYRTRAIVRITRGSPRVVESWVAYISLDGVCSCLATKPNCTITDNCALSCLFIA